MKEIMYAVGLPIDIELYSAVPHYKQFHGLLRKIFRLTISQNDILASFKKENLTYYKTEELAITHATLGYKYNDTDFYITRPCVFKVAVEEFNVNSPIVTKIISAQIPEYYALDLNLDVDNLTQIDIFNECSNIIMQPISSDHHHANMVTTTINDLKWQHLFNNFQKIIIYPCVSSYFGGFVCTAFFQLVNNLSDRILRLLLPYDDFQLTNERFYFYLKASFYHAMLYLLGAPLLPSVTCNLIATILEKFLECDNQEALLAGTLASFFIHRNTASGLDFPENTLPYATSIFLSSLAGSYSFNVIYRNWNAIEKKTVSAFDATYKFFKSLTKKTSNNNAALNDSPSEFNLLHSAVMSGNLDSISEVLSTGKFNINCISTETGITPLFIACDSKGNEDIINLLVKNGADINLKCNGDTPIRKAIKCGNLKVVKALINYSANIFGEKSKPMEELFNNMLDATIDDVCDVSDPNAAIDILNDITKSFLIYSCSSGQTLGNVMSQELPNSYNLDSTDEPNINLGASDKLANAIKMDKKLIRTKQSAFQIRQILQEDERTISASYKITGASGRLKQTTIIPNSFSSVKQSMSNVYKGLQPGDISIACYKLILNKQQKLQEKLISISSQEKELQRLKEENSQLTEKLQFFTKRDTSANTKIDQTQEQVSNKSFNI